MIGQIGMANGIGFRVQCETYASNGENKIIITGVDDANIKCVYEQARIIETYVKKNILNFNNLDLHFNFISDCKYNYVVDGTLAMLMSLISKLRNIPIENTFIFCGQLDLYGNLFIEKLINIEKTKEILNQKTVYSPSIIGSKNIILINSINELAEKFPILLKPKTSPPYNNRLSEFLKYKL